MGDTNTRDCFFDCRFQRCKMLVYVFKTRLAVFQRHICYINVNRISRKIPMKQVYCGASVDSEILYLEYKRHYSYQQGHLSTVYVIHNHLILWGQ